MAQRLQKRDGTFSDEAKQSTDSIKSIRFVVLGSDEVLTNEACDIILGSTDKTTKHGTCEFREACVSGRHVSVVKAHAYWLENSKTYLSFSKGVRSMKMDMEFCYSLVFPGPHAFLLVLGDVRNSGKEHYILQALCEVFGQEALDYCMVLFMHEYRDSDIDRNRCVRKCRKRFHILKRNEDNENNVLKLFHDATGTMIKKRKANFFTKDLDLLDKAETYFKREFDAKYEERESSLRADLAEMKTTEENLRTNITEMEKQNSKNVRELQDLREELDAHRARENQLRKELDASRSREIQLSQQMELKEELCALRYYKRLVEHAASSEREIQLKSDREKLQRELEQLKGSEKRLEENPRESKDRPKEEFPLTKIQLEHNTLQEQKEAQAQEEHDRPRTSDRREMELDVRKRKLLMQTVTGSEQCHPISTAVTPPSVSEDKDKQLEFEGLKLVRQNSKKLDPPDVSENKVKPLSERERAIDLQSIKGEGVKPARGNSIQDPPNMSEDKPQEDTGYLEFEGLKLVRENSKKLDPPDGGAITHRLEENRISRSKIKRKRSRNKR